MSDYIKAINSNDLNKMWIIDIKGRPCRLDSKNLPAKALYWFIERSLKWVKFLEDEYVKPKPSVAKRKRRKSVFGKSSPSMNMDVPAKNISIYNEEKYVK